MSRPQPWPAELGDPPWPGTLDEECSNLGIENLLGGRDGRQAVFPGPAGVFEAFRRTPFQEVRVVIVGQDPYPTPGLATGLAFSVPRGTHPLPASLRNIHQAMRQDGLTPPDHGDLTGWADQGVLLLNTALTVPEGEPGAHIRAWRPFTDAVVRHLDNRDEPVVFVLWGAKAQRLRKLIKSPHHPVITAPHPASRGIHQTKFRQSESFSRVNDELAARHRGGVAWEIP